MKSVSMSLARSLIALFALSALPIAALADELNMPIGVTALSREIYDLHMLIFWICVAIGVVVFGAMAISMVLHRKSRGYEPATFHESTKVEIAWTVVPLVILVAMAIPATRVLIEMYDFGGEDLAIEVRGYQWKWEYTYLDEDLNEQLSFFSNLATPSAQIQNVQDKTDTYLLEVDKPLVIPVGKKVRFLMTSNDVIHSWWVPDFAVKKDAIPGFVNETWALVEEPGIYRGQCTELCGKDHGFMPVVVHVLPQAEYDVWYAEQMGVAVIEQQLDERQWAPEELLAKGEEVYSVHCIACHQSNGQGVPPVFPAIAGSAVATGPVNEHLEVVYNGRAGTAMQAFGQQLSASDIAAVMHYQRNAFGNETGDVIQPQDVLAYSQGQ